VDGVTVTRIGTQVVVRLSGHVGDERRPRLEEALQEVASLAINRVVIDLDDVTSIQGAGIDFIVALQRRWRVKLLNAPAELRERLPRTRTVTLVGDALSAAREAER
jgi:anti-anti-sigma regulatory factor